jgi:ubiquinone/menaquinone biosynthesis C-methylase UbiE
MAPSAQPCGPQERLAEQIAYYRAIAPERRRKVGRARWEELDAVLEGFELAGRHVLEIAGGPGTWTATLASRAGSLTALDASPEMQALAAERAGVGAGVRFIERDLASTASERLRFTNSQAL